MPKNTKYYNNFTMSLQELKGSAHYKEIDIRINDFLRDQPIFLNEFNGSAQIENLLLTRFARSTVHSLCPKYQIAASKKSDLDITRFTVNATYKGDTLNFSFKHPELGVRFQSNWDLTEGDEGRIVTAHCVALSLQSQKDVALIPLLSKEELDIEFSAYRAEMNKEQQVLEERLGNLKLIKDDLEELQAQLLGKLQGAQAENTRLSSSLVKIKEELQLFKTNSQQLSVSLDEAQIDREKIHQLHQAQEIEYSKLSQKHDSLSQLYANLSQERILSNAESAKQIYTLKQDLRSVNERASLLQQKSDEQAIKLAQLENPSFLTLLTSIAVRFLEGLSYILSVVVSAALTKNQTTKVDSDQQASSEPCPIPLNGPVLLLNHSRSREKSDAIQKIHQQPNSNLKP